MRRRVLSVSCPAFDRHHLAAETIIDPGPREPLPDQARQKRAQMHQMDHRPCPLDESDRGSCRRDRGVRQEQISDLPPDPQPDLEQREASEDED